MASPLSNRHYLNRAASYGLQHPPMRYTAGMLDGFAIFRFSVGRKHFYRCSVPSGVTRDNLAFGSSNCSPCMVGPSINKLTDDIMLKL